MDIILLESHSSKKEDKNKSDDAFLKWKEVNPDKPIYEYYKSR